MILIFRDLNFTVYLNTIEYKGDLGGQAIIKHPNDPINALLQQPYIA